jgi:hypothetical protein
MVDGVFMTNSAIYGEAPAGLVVNRIVTQVESAPALTPQVAGYQPYAAPVAAQGTQKQHGNTPE